MHILAFKIGVDYGVRVVFVFVMIPFAPSHLRIFASQAFQRFIAKDVSCCSDQFSPGTTRQVSP